MIVKIIRKIRPDKGHDRKTSILQRSEPRNVHRPILFRGNMRHITTCDSQRSAADSEHNLRTNEERYRIHSLYLRVQQAAEHHDAEGQY